MGARRPVVVAVIAATVAWALVAACIPPPRQPYGGYNSGYASSPYGQQPQQTTAGCTTNADCSYGQVCFQENAYQAGACVDGCTSDFGCAYGSKCVKGQYQMTGVCAQSVNEYGVRTYEPPSSDSVGPGDDGDCGIDTDCAIGFRCVKQGYSLRGHCMK
jgi:hypothetical protein